VFAVLYFSFLCSGVSVSKIISIKLHNVGHHTNYLSHFLKTQPQDDLRRSKHVVILYIAIYLIYEFHVAVYHVIKIVVFTE